MVEYNSNIGTNQTDASTYSESRKKDSNLCVLFKFYRLLFKKWYNKKKNQENKHERKLEEANHSNSVHPHKGIMDIQEEKEERVDSFRYKVDVIGGETPMYPGGFSKSRSVDHGGFPFSPSRLSKSSSRRSTSSPTPSYLYRSMSGYEGASPALSRNASRRSTTPIMFSNSNGMTVKPPALEKMLECTLEELCFGCTKKIKITRDALTTSGQLALEEVLSIKVKPGWKKGTKITFEGKGNEVPGTQPADLIFVISEKRHQLFRRDGDDLELALEIPLVKALTGCTITVPLLGGEKMDLSIDDEIIYPGYEKMIEGQGMPVKDQQGARGNLKLLFLVEFPSELTDDERSNVRSILEDCC